MLDFKLHATLESKQASVLMLKQATVQRYKPQKTSLSNFSVPRIEEVDRLHQCNQHFTHKKLKLVKFNFFSTTDIVSTGKVRLIQGCCTQSVKLNSTGA